MTIYAIEMGDAWLSGASMELHMHGQTYGLENNYIIREFETGEWME